MNSLLHYLNLVHFYEVDLRNFGIAVIGVIFSTLCKNEKNLFAFWNKAIRKEEGGKH